MRKSTRSCREIRLTRGERLPVVEFNHFNRKSDMMNFTGAFRLLSGEVRETRQPDHHGDRCDSDLDEPQSHSSSIVSRPCYTAESGCGYRQRWSAIREACSFVDWHGGRAYRFRRKRPGRAL